MIQSHILSKEQSMRTGLVLLCLMTMQAAAQTYVTELAAKAQPDEWFNGIGQPYTPLGAQAPGAAGQPKVNYDYVWSLTASGDYVWFGDVGNLVCRVSAIRNYLNLDRLGDVDYPPVYDVPYRTCEFDDSQTPWVPRYYPRFLKALLGDFRPPRVWRYDTRNGSLQNMTPSDGLINQTAGLRSAGANSEIVFLAGPHLVGFGVNFFAFDAVTGEYLGSRRFLPYGNIRRFVTVNDVIYTCVLDEYSGGNAGTILRWSGTRRNPFRFEAVGRIRNEGGYIAAHDNRLFVATWPDVSEVDEPVSLQEYAKIIFDRDGGRHLTAGLWMSPPIPPGGLRFYHASSWRKVWDTLSFEPDPVTVQTLSGGALTSFDGWLYFGTLQFPGRGLDTFIKVYGTPANLQEALDNTTRASTLFRGRNFGEPNQEVQMLYADASLPVYTPGRFGGPGTWAAAPNRMGAGQYGPAGFGNPDNIYTWSMDVYDHQLFVGTFDQGIYVYGQDYMDGIPVPVELGGDLYRFPSSASPAVMVDENGLGNVLNHGFRNMITTPRGLFIGSANIANMLTDPNDAFPEGGWELIKLMKTE